MADAVPVIGGVLGGVLGVWLDAWLDLVHGGRCVGCEVPGRALCHGCAALLPTVGLSVRPTPCPPGLAACFAAGEYAGTLRAMVLAHKEHAVLSLAGPMGLLLARAVAPAVARLAPAPSTSASTSARTGERPLVVLVPVPSRPEVVRARGHDPMLRVTRVAAQVLRRQGHRVTVARAAVARFPVADQAGLGSAGRVLNLRGSMGVSPAVRARLAHRGTPVCVVVCDDVLTTGATAREAQRCLEEAGIPVRAVATVAATRRLRPPGRSPSGAARRASR